MKATLLLDYVTFNYAVGTVSPESIAKTVSGDDYGLRWHKVGLSENSLLKSPFGMSYLPNSGFDARPHRLQISGNGCLHYEPLLTDLRNLAENHISRCDFAFDIMVRRSDWRNFITTVVNQSMNSENRINRRYTFAGSGEAVTIYIGSRRCAKFCRIYNKSLEDKDYSYSDADGVEYKTTFNDDGEPVDYIIRYEIEFKHFKGKGQNFDPSCLFDSYYHNQEEVINEVLDVWRIYSEEFLLPCPIDELELTCRSNKFLFCSTRDAALQFVNDTKFNSPRVFDSTVSYIANRFGKYIPFIIANPFLKALCIQKCEIWSGFKADIYIGSSESGFYENYEESEDSNEADLKNQIPDFDEITLY